MATISTPGELSQLVSRQHDIIDKASLSSRRWAECTNVYVNSIEEAALKKGRPYPDKTMFFVDLHEFTVSEGSYVEGPRKPTAIMLKDNRETRNDKSEFISNKDRGDTTDSALAHVLASHI
jgi:hypothetical protein